MPPTWNHIWLHLVPRTIAAKPRVSPTDTAPPAGLAALNAIACSPPMIKNTWLNVMAVCSGLFDEQARRSLEYLKEENRVFREQLRDKHGCRQVRWSDTQRHMLRCCYCNRCDARRCHRGYSRDFEPVLPINGLVHTTTCWPTAPAVSQVIAVRPGFGRSAISWLRSMELA